MMDRSAPWVGACQSHTFNNNFIFFFTTLLTHALPGLWFLDCLCYHAQLRGESGGRGEGRAGKIARRVRNGEAGDKMRLERKGLHPPSGPVGGGKRKDDTSC